MKSETRYHLPLIKFSSLSMFVFILMATPLSADDWADRSSPASGSDIWTGAMAKLGLFVPHENDCVSGETFVTVLTDEYGVAQGFCIDNNENSVGSKTWTEARGNCFASLKRLPEPGEFKHICLNVGGLSNLTDDYEWTSNFSQNVSIDAVNSVDGVAAATMGNGSCAKASTAWVASSSAAESTLPFRCIR